MAGVLIAIVDLQYEQVDAFFRQGLTNEAKHQGHFVGLRSAQVKTSNRQYKRGSANGYRGNQNSQQRRYGRANDELLHENTSDKNRISRKE